VFFPLNDKPMSQQTPRTMVLGHLLDGEGRVLDSALCVLFPGPGSYTGEDCAEIHCHGSPVVLNEGLKLLLSHGADAERQTSVGGGALFYVLHHKIPLAETLLNSGANPNAFDGNGNLLLTRAVIRYGDFDFARLLLKHGAKINAADANGDSPLVKAVKSNEPLFTMNFLLNSGANPNEKLQNGSPLLTYAVIDKGKFDTAHALLKRGAKINATDKNGKTALMRALEERKSDKTVAFLLENKANAKIDGAFLAGLEQDRSTKILDLLLKRGADINERSSNGTTPLLFACREKSASLVSWLLQKGASATLITKEGVTTLMAAAQAHPRLLKQTRLAQRP